MLTIKFLGVKVDKLSVYELLLFNVCTFLLLIKNTNKDLNWNSMFLLLLGHFQFYKIIVPDIGIYQNYYRYLLARQLLLELKFQTDTNSLWYIVFSQ